MEDFLKTLIGRKIDVFCGANSSLRGDVTKVENGVLHLQDDDGQVLETHSISAGLDYPGVGPEHAHLKDIGRVEYTWVTDTEALEIALVENLQRQDLGPLEEAFAFRRLGDEFGLTQEAVATRVGRSRSSVANSRSTIR